MKRSIGTSYTVWIDSKNHHGKWVTSMLNLESSTGEKASLILVHCEQTRNVLLSKDV